MRVFLEIGRESINALEAANAVKIKSTRRHIGSGDKAGKILGDLIGDEDSMIVHRAAFLRELLKSIPPSAMHVLKKLVRVEDSGGGVLLYFSDNTQEYADLLVGADGIHGYVRGYILGPEHPATKPKFSGWWDCRALVPFEKAVEALGDEFFKEHRQHSWLGDGGYMMHDVLNGGETVQCVAAVLTGENWDPNEWKKPLDRKMLEDSFATWKDGPIAPGMIELLLQNPEPLAYAEWDHRDAPTFFKGRVCMIGDSAHAMTPWQGSGASQAIEDVMILAKLLGNTSSPSQLTAALGAYDHVRRPRSQAVVESSRTSGLILCGRAPGIGLDPEKLQSALHSRWNFIYNLDMQDHQDEALRHMKALCPDFGRDHAVS